MGEGVISRGVMVPVGDLGRASSAASYSLSGSFYDRQLLQAQLEA
jgi:hypothetical protein